MIQPVHVSKQIKQISNIDSTARRLLDLALEARHFAAATFCRNSQCIKVNVIKIELDVNFHFLQLTKM